MSDITIRTPVSCTLPHRARKLPNGASIVAIQDKDCTMPAAAMTVGVGSLCDPSDFPGLAHFCEHMLFMGTDNYPGEDEYETAVSRAGGHSNAWTASDSTTYYYTANNTKFLDIIPMFLDFFVCPLFSPSGVERELQAVHSEDEKNHAIDFWRLNELLHSFVVPEHPAFRYGNGNLTTLKDEPTAKGLDIVAALRTFFNQHYTADAMCLAVYSPFDADVIFDLASAVLANVKVATAPIPALKLIEQQFPSTMSVVAPSAAKKWYNVTSMSKVPSVQVMWVLNGVGTASFKTSPSMWISSIFGHEVKGSVASIVRELGWGTEVVGGTGSALDSCHSTFYVKISLTTAGLEHVEDVVGLVYQQVQYLKNLGTMPLDSYAGVQTEHRISFELSDVRRAEDHVATLSSQAVLYGVENAVSGGHAIYDSAPEASFDILQQLSPDQGVVILHIGDSKDLVEAVSKAPTSTSFFGDSEAFTADETDGHPNQLKTRFHGMIYSEAVIPDRLLTKWSGITPADIHPSFSLPQPNPFLAEDFTIYPREKAEEVTAESAVTPDSVSSTYGSVWVKQSTVGTLPFSPKIAGVFSFICPGVFSASPDGTPKFAAVDAYYLRVALKMLDEQLVDVTYYAELASISSHITPSAAGIVITVNGPSSNVPDFVVQLVSLTFLPKESTGKLIAEGTPELFATHHDSLTRKLSSICETQPIRIASTSVSDASNTELQVSWEDELKIGVPAATYSGYVAFLRRLVSSVRMEAVINGNIKSTEDIKHRVIDRIDDTLKEGKVDVAPQESIPHYRSFYRLPLAPTADHLGGKGQHFFNLVTRDALSATNVNAAVMSRFEVAYMDKNSSQAEYRQCLIAECLGKLISSPFFNTLRTTEALGYMVSAQMTNHLSQAMYLQFGVQSAVAGSWYLLSRISAFLDAYETDALPKITQADVDGVVKAMIEALRQPPMSVAQECNKIYSKRVHPRGFTAGVEAAAILESMPITIEEIKNAFATTLSNLDQGGKVISRRNITVSISSNALKLKEPTHEFTSSSSGTSPSGTVQKSCAFPLARSDVAKAPTASPPEGGGAEDGTKLVMKRFDEDVSKDDATPHIALWRHAEDIRSVSTLVDVPI